MKPTRRLSLVLAGTAACVAVAQQPAPSQPPDEEDVPEVEQEWDFAKGRGHDLTMLDRLVPEGQSHKGLRYPIYSEPKDGKAPVLESQFESKLVTRVDTTHLQFKDAVVSIFGDKRFPDVATRMISLVEACYDLQNDLLFSNAPVQILDRDMTIRSGSVLRDSVTGITVFGNGVKIYFAEPPPPPPPSPSPPPPPSPPSSVPKEPSPPPPGK